MKSLSVIAIAATVGVVVSCGTPDVSAAKDIVHDGEFNYIKAQHGEKWAKQDKTIGANSNTARYPRTL